MTNEIEKACAEIAALKAEINALFKELNISQQKDILTQIK